MPSTALQSLRRTVTVSWPASSEAGARAHLIAVARAGHARIMRDATARAGVAPDFTAYANSPGRPVEAVVLPGPIVYRYVHHREIAVTALKWLREASPVHSGRYRSTHTLYVNGVPVEALPASLKRTDTIYISNPLAYARKLEIGKTESGRDFLVSVPNRIYERTMKRLQAQFGRTARITFGYITPPDAATLRRDNPGRGRRHASRGRRAGDAVRSPAIFIELLT